MGGENFCAFFDILLFSHLRFKEKYMKGETVVTEVLRDNKIQELLTYSG